MEKIYYSEEQTVPRLIISIILGVLACALIIAFFIDFILAGVIGILVFVAIILLLWNSGLKLITKVYQDKITVAYRGKLTPSGMFIADFNFWTSINGKDDIEFPLEWITKYEVFEYEALKDFGSWGKRNRSQKGSTGDIGTFTASGKQAILLTLRSDKKILIGTQQPQKLLLALQTVMNS